LKDIAVLQLYFGIWTIKYWHQVSRMDWVGGYYFIFKFCYEWSWKSSGIQFL